VNTSPPPVHPRASLNRLPRANVRSATNAVRLRGRTCACAWRAATSAAAIRAHTNTRANIFTRPAIRWCARPSQGRTGGGATSTSDWA